MAQYRDDRWKSLIESLATWYYAVKFFVEHAAPGERPSSDCSPPAALLVELRELAKIDPTPIYDLYCKIETWYPRHGRSKPRVPFKKIQAGFPRCRLIWEMACELGTVKDDATTNGRVEKVAVPTDPRNKWAYDQFTRYERGALVTHKTILKRLETKCSKLNWTTTDICSLKRDANKWAGRNDKPPIPARQHGLKPRKVK